jgi:heat shock protein HslJ
LLVVAVVALTACGVPMPWDGDRPTIEGITWRAVTVDGGPPLPGSEITIRLGPDSLSGFGGCNRFGSERLTIGEGSYADGKPIEIGGISSDDAVCDTEVMRQEAEFLEDLAVVRELRIESGQLELAGPKGTLRFEQVSTGD